MVRLPILCAILAACYSSATCGQAITGRVISSSSSPIADVSVSLKVRGISNTTDASGNFTLDPSSTLPPALKQGIRSNICYNGRSFVITATAPEKIVIEEYALSGKKTRTIANKIFGAGTHEVPLATGKNAAGLSIIRMVKGGDRFSLAFAGIDPRHSVLSGNTSPMPVHKQAASPATVGGEVLMVAKAGYNPRSLDIISYATQNVGDIVLLTVAEDSATIERKVDSLLALMNNAQKAGQMVQAMNSLISPADVTQYGFGSVFNGGEEPVNPNTPTNWANRLNALQDGALASPLKIPMIYGLDAVHGNGKVVGSTIFPHNIALGCTGDSALVERVGRITACECRALGIHLTFAPCVSVVRDERWGRTYEGFGETPEINSRMGAAFIRGLQGDGDMSRPSAIAGNVKHYLGDGGTAGGVNGGTTTLSEATMRAVHFPPYQRCAKEKMASVMPSYNAWSRNGQTIKQTIDSVSLTVMLKKEQNWDGFILTDYDAIPQALTGGYTPQNVGRAVMAGVDMAMIPSRDNSIMFRSSVQSAVENGYLTQARLDDAVRRILRIKLRLNLWERPKSQSAMMSRIGCPDHRAVARETVRKSLVLLKNSNSALPLLKTENVVVVGPWANKMGAQCGGWTIGWQGDVNYSVQSVGGGQTILQGLQQVGGSNVTWEEQGNNLTNANKIVLVLGETPYAEGQGDNNNPAISQLQNASLIDKCSQSGKPVICVLISGRPLIIGDKLASFAAFVAAWLPGTEGIGVADVLYNDYNFSGKLTHSWPNTLNQIPINSGPTYTDEPKGSGGDPLFPYGYGLTY